MSRLLRYKGKRSAAQAMVEFGLALPILLLVMYGLIESGRLLLLYASVVSGARQAVRYGSVTGLNASGVPYFNDCAGIRATAKGFSFIQPFIDSNIEIRYDNGPGATNPWSQATCPITSLGHPVNGDRIYVRVSTQYAPIVPLVPFRPFAISSSGWRTLLVGVSIPVPVPGVVLTPGTGGAMSMLKDAWCASCTPPGSYYESVGQAITYIYTIHNLGSDPILGISVVDIPAGNANCAGLPNPLNGGSSGQCTATYYITQADIDHGSVTNTATAKSNSPPLTAQASKTINFSPKPKLTLAKDGEPPTIVARGQPITYTFTLTNSGNVALLGPYTINDPKLDSWDCSKAVSPLAIGASTTCTGTHILTNNDMSATVVNNTATATAMYGAYVVTSNSASASVLVPELLLTMGASPSSVTLLGQTITYTYTLTNRTASSMSNLKISDSRGANNYACLSSLAAGATNSCTRTYSAYTQADMDAGMITDIASASGQGGVNSNTATISVTVVQNPQLTLTKKASVDTATTVGTVITYSYTVQNSGNVTLSGLGLTDDKIPGVQCPAASVPPNSIGACPNTNYTVTQADLDAGSIINHAVASATFKGSTYTSNTASATVITYIGPRLGLQKTANPTVYSSQGQTITYTYTLQNTGSVPLTSPYTVTDTLIPSGIDCSKAVSPLNAAQTTTCTGTYLISAGDMNAPTVTNSAAATATNGTSPITSTPSPTTATITRFLCDASHLFGKPNPIPGGADAIWTIVNNTGLTVHIASAMISWSAPPPAYPPYLLEVLLGGTTIWSGTGSSSGGFSLPVPTGGWALPTGNTNMELKFSADASSIRVYLTFKETACGGLDSNP